MAVVNEAAVREIFAGRSPVGRVVDVSGRQVEIVGVVSDSRYARAREAVQPVLFDAALQRAGFGGHHVVLRTAGTPTPDLEERVRRAVARVDADLPVPELRTQTRQIELTSARERVFAQLLTIFGGFALLLASLGIHGVTSYLVSRRTSEIGLRVALGARPSGILWLVLRQVAVVAAAGLVVGVPLALAAGPLVSSLLYGVAPGDAMLVAGAAAMMAAVALSAALLPARRAVRVDAITALRTE